MADIDMNRAAMIVSCDSHVGPKLVEHLRPYCPRKHLEAFDEDAARQFDQATARADTLNAAMDDQMRPARAVS